MRVLSRPLCRAGAGVFLSRHSLGVLRAGLLCTAICGATGALAIAAPVAVAFATSTVEPLFPAQAVFQATTPGLRANTLMALRGVVVHVGFIAVVVDGFGNHFLSEVSVHLGGGVDNGDPAKARSMALRGALAALGGACLVGPLAFAAGMVATTATTTMVVGGELPQTVLLVLTALCAADCLRSALAKTLHVVAAPWLYMVITALVAPLATTTAASFLCFFFFLDEPTTDGATLLLLLQAPGGWKAACAAVAAGSVVASVLLGAIVGPTDAKLCCTSGLGVQRVWSGAPNRTQAHSILQRSVNLVVGSGGNNDAAVEYASLYTTAADDEDAVGPHAAALSRRGNSDAGSSIGRGGTSISDGVVHGTMDADGDIELTSNHDDHDDSSSFVDDADAVLVDAASVQINVPARISGKGQASSSSSSSSSPSSSSSSLTTTTTVAASTKRAKAQRASVHVVAGQALDKPSFVRTGHGRDERLHVVTYAGDTVALDPRMTSFDL